MHSRNTTGTVVIEEKQGKWRIRLPRTVAKDAARYISTRLDATPSNYRKVQRKVFEIEEEIANGQFDVTLVKYQFKPQVLALVASAPLAPIALRELWARYCEFMRPQLAPTTFVKEYVGRYTSHINNLPSQDLNDAVAIRDYLLQQLSPYTANRTLARLSSCCAWAVDSKLITANPFKEFPPVSQRASAHEPNPFTREERDAIIAAFAAHPKYSHYTSFVRFLFLTGCRTGEAIGLLWQHVNKDCTVITFCSSYDSYLNIHKPTKTGTVRRFPCNKVLQELLLSKARGSHDDFVFTSITGKPIDNANFTSRMWRGGSGAQAQPGIVTQLVEQGLVDSYRCLYNTRHTFITMALEGGMTIPQVAKLVGNSPQVILDHYAGNLLKFDVPVT